MPNYPRPGGRIAPELFRAELTVQVRMLNLEGVEETFNLADLDESAWDRFSPQACALLARQVISRITTTISMALLSDTRKHQGMFIKKPPQLPAGLGLLDLPLEDATVATLQKEGLLNDPDSFAEMTVRDLTMIPRFGARRLVDLVTALEEALARYTEAPATTPSRQRRRTLDQCLAEWQQRYSGSQVHRRDPRFGWHLRAMDRSARSVEDLRVKLHQEPNPDQAGRFERLLEAMEAAGRLTLEEELAEVTLNSGVKPRHADLLLRYRGWTGHGEVTLQAVGDSFGLTRERVRQITTLAETNFPRPPAYLPVLERVMALAEEMAPAACEEIEAAIQAAGLSRICFRLEGVLSASRVLHRPCNLVIVEYAGRRFAAPAELASLPEVAVSAAQRAVDQGGAERLENITSAVVRKIGQVVGEKAVARALALAPDCQILDEEGGWVWFGPGRRSRVLNHIEKIFCVCEEINLNELLDGVLRSYRMQEAVPPKKILLEICRRIPWLEVSHWNLIRRRMVPDTATVLSASERTIAAILSRHNNMMSWGELKNLCLDAGMIKVTYDVTIMNSPIFKKIAKGTYGLRGLEITSHTLAACLPRSGSFKPTRNKPDVGVLQDGRIYIVFRVTEYLMKSGLVFIPSVFRERITHGRYELVDVQQEVLGVLSCYNASNLYGIKKIARQQQWQVNEQFKLTFEVAARRVTVERLGQARVHPSMGVPLVSAEG